jgi:hypothetical protein
MLTSKFPLALAWILAVTAAACSQSNGNERPATSQTNTFSSPQTNTQKAPNMPSNASIGTATMKDDGTIVLMLRATGPGGMLGDSRIEYPKGHPNYDEVLKHLGGLKPGEQKPVPPWP